MLKTGDTATVILSFSEPVINFNFDDDIRVENGTLLGMNSNDQITWIGTFAPSIGVESYTNSLTLNGSAYNAVQ